MLHARLTSVSWRTLLFSSRTYCDLIPSNSQSSPIFLALIHLRRSLGMYSRLSLHITETEVRLSVHMSFLVAYLYIL